jgi:hypothetical protein
MYQVFICLNLNGISLWPSLCKTPLNLTIRGILASLDVVRFSLLGSVWLLTALFNPDI